MSKVEEGGGVRLTPLPPQVLVSLFFFEASRVISDIVFALIGSVVSK